MWGAIASVAGSALGGIASAIGQHQANKQNVALSREQMAFQERMSNTAYQRATADMRKAGINPMLAYQQGGASSPSGSMATVENEAPELSGAVSSAIEAARLKKEIRQVDSQIDLNAASAKAANNQAQLAAENAKRVKEETEILKYDKEGAKVRGDYEREWGSKAIRARELMNLMNSGINSAGGLMDLINPLRKIPVPGTKRTQETWSSPKGTHHRDRSEWYD